LSRPNLVYCLVFDCKKNKHPVQADASQVKDHLWKHGFKTLLKTAKSLNLIEDYARPTRKELVEVLSNHSIIREESI